MPFTEDLSTESEYALQILGIAIWAAFAIEYVVLIYLSPDRRQTILTHKLDLALVVMPFLRPLRLARLARLAHAGTAFARAGVAVSRLLGRPGFTTMIGTVAALIFAGGGLVTIAEHGQPGSTIQDFGDPKHASMASSHQTSEKNRAHKSRSPCSSGYIGTCHSAV